MNKGLFLFFILWGSVINAFSQEVEIDSTQFFVHPPVVALEEEGETGEEQEKTQLPVIRILSADSVRSIRREKDFGYMSTLDSLLRESSKLQSEAPEAETKPSRSVFDSGLIRFLLWTTAIAIVLFLLYQLLGSQKNLFAKNKKLNFESEEESGETEGPVSLVQKIRNAVAKEDYRLAVRFQYLYLLEGLAGKKMLQLLPQKTNQQYLNELPSEDMRSGFATLTFQYEYIWFGRFELNREQYDQVLAGFRNYMEKWL